MHKHSVSIGFVVLPLSFVVVSICMDELALSFCFVILPLSLVNSSIWPFLPSRSVSQVSQPLAFILYAVFEFLQCLFLSLDPSSCLYLFRQCGIKKFSRIIILIGS